MKAINRRETSEYALASCSYVDVEKLLRERYGVRGIVRDGDEIRCSCPLPFGMHPRGDRNPSFSVNVESRLANCFKCGGGNMMWFIKVMEPRTPSGDYISNAEIASIAREYAEELDIDRILERSKESGRNAASGWKVPTASSTAFSEHVEAWSKNKTDYWASRGLTQETVEMWKLGFDPEERRAIVPHVFEYEVVGWTGRAVADDVVPKWKHSYKLPKDTTLFSYDNAVRYPQVVVVEAPISALWLWQMGIQNVVATFGASVTLNQERLLRRFDEVVLWMDGDVAGWKATLDLVERLRGHTTVQVVDSWSGDPAEKSADECWNLVFEKGLIPGFMFEQSMLGNIDRVTLNGIHEVRKSRLAGK